MPTPAGRGGTRLCQMGWSFVIAPPRPTPLPTRVGGGRVAEACEGVVERMRSARRNACVA
jgi:hypothetical protein